MKRIYSLLLLMAVLSTVTTWSQTTYTWQGVNDASWQGAANWVPARSTPAATDILLFNTSGTRRITNLPTDQTVAKIVISNGTTIRLASVSGLQTLRIGSGFAAAGDEFVIENGSSLIQENTFNEIRLQNNASAGIAGTYTIQAAEGFWLNNTGVVATVTGKLVNQGAINNATAAKLVFTGGAYEHLMDGGTIPTATWNAGSTCEISGMTSNYPGGMGQTFQSVTFSSTISDDIEMSSDLTCLQNLTIAIGAGAGDDFRGTNSNIDRTITVGGKFTLSSGRFVLDHDNGGSDLNVTGGFELGGTATFLEDGSNSVTVNFNGTAVQTFSKAATAAITGTVNFVINNNAKVDFGTSVLNGSLGTFTLSGGGKIITAHANGLSATGSVQITRVYSSTADYEFQGGSTGVFTTSADPQVRNFTVRNTTTNNVLLSKAMTVNGVLELANGYLTTTPNLLTVGNAGSSTTANGAFVNGPLAKVITSITTFPFHVGTVSGGLRTISATSVNPGGATSTTFTARFFNSNPQTVYAGATVATGIEAISACEYWTLDRSTGAGTKYNAAVTLSWSAASSCGPAGYITDPTKLKVLRHNGGAPGVWTDAGYASSTPGTVKSNTVTSFSPFTIGTTDGEANPLPVIFADVKAYEKNGGVQIEWSNLTEKDVAEYTIERSTNGRDFGAIGMQLPASNQDDKASYTAFDAVPGAGANYYRIKGEETTGKIVYSKVLSVILGKASSGLRLYPNPVSGNQLTVSLSNVKQGKYNLRVVNTAGQDIFKHVISNQSSSLTQTLDLPLSIKPGVYNMIITGDNYRETKTFIVQ